MTKKCSLQVAFVAHAYARSLPRYRFMRFPICPETLRTTAEMIDGYVQADAQEKTEWRRDLKPPSMIPASEHVAITWCRMRTRPGFFEAIEAIGLTAYDCLTPEAKALLRQPKTETEAEEV